MSADEQAGLIDALADGALHSGATLAQQFGISRAALAKRIDKLRELGLPVQAQAGAGYQLHSPLERLDAAQLRAAIALPQGASAVPISVYWATDSTNTRLLEADPQCDPQLAFAEYQRGGRGRRGRSWVAPFGSNILMSLSFRFDAWPPRLTTLPLALAVASVRALAACGVTDVGIKWPNDLQIQRRKLAGILVEPRGEAGGDCRVVAGIGLNYSVPGSLLAQLPQPAVSLRASREGAGLPSPSRNQLAAALAQAWLFAFEDFARNGFDHFAGEWQALDVLRGQALVLDDEPALQATGVGINEDGALLLRTPVGIRSVHAGEVRVRQVAGEGA